ncbi:antibiotic biosynthesis monooxygenase family protein [Chloroflexota bacterium]
MYAVVYKFKLESVSEEETKAIVSRILERLKGAKGLVSVVIYCDEETNEWGRTTVWETKEDSVAYGDSVRPSERHKQAMEVVDGPLERKGYDVIGYATAD